MGVTIMSAYRLYAIVIDTVGVGYYGTEDYGTVVP